MTRIAAILMLILCFMLPVITVWAHDVKDPVCRMTVDSDATPHTHKVAGKTYYFCSKACVDTFAASPDKYVRLSEQLDNNAREYVVEFKTVPRPLVHRPVPMSFAVRYADTKKLVRDYELVHERLMHLVMVSEDLAWFDHQHPLRGKDGIFRLTWKFPRPGRYHLYTDFTPSDGDNQILQSTLVVGTTAMQKIPLQPDRILSRQVGGYRIDLKVNPERLRMEQAALLTYTIRDRDGKPVSDMQPYIGAMGHIFAVSANGEEVVHTHAMHPTGHEAHGASSSGGMSVTPEMATEKGPAFTFKLTLPTSGLYKVWAQFMHNNRVLTVPFTFNVAELWEQTKAVKETVAKPATGQNAVQRLTVTIDGGYSPSKLLVRRGQPVEVTFVRREKAGCGDVVHFPTLGIKRTLKAGAKTTVSFTPQQSGTLRFTCGMDMYRGEIVVR